MLKNMGREPVTGGGGLLVSSSVKQFPKNDLLKVEVM
jgi:hypothetical protein